MFGSIGGGEILMILTLALLLFGPRRLPQIGKTLGRTMAEFRRATHDLKNSLEHEVEREDLKEAREGLQSAGREIVDAVSASNPLSIARGALEGPETGSEADNPARSTEDGPSTAPPDSGKVDRP